MEIAILILLHEFGLQQKFLIQHLSNNFDVFVHVDKKSKINVKDVAKIAGNIFVYKEYKVFWGHYSQILATLYLFKMANFEKKYNRFVFISGSDFPIKTNQQIQSFFEQTNKEYLYFEELPRECWNGNGGYDRIDYFYNKIYRGRSNFLLKILSKLNNNINCKIIIKFLKLIKIRRNRNGIKYFGGPNWMDLTDNCVSQIIEFLECNPWYIRRFKYTRCADEIFFQTLILNFAKNLEIEKKCLRYVDWKNGPEYPRILRSNDYNKLKESDCLFARKVDDRVDFKIIYKIMRIINSKYESKSDDSISLVTIRCTVYNQAPFLRQCLDGFVMQKTTFPFIALVHDDASTDGSADIIKEYSEKYPEIIKPIYETDNQWSKHDGSLGKIMDSHIEGKYVAYCEGDDYWIDPYKLQKQISFLESHPDYGMCYSSARVFIDGKKEFRKERTGKKTNLKKIMWGNNTIPTCTVCMRTDLSKKYKQEIDYECTSKWRMGDLPLWIYAMMHSKVKFINSDTSVYRIRTNSASHSEDINKQILFRKNIYEIKDFFKKKYELPYKIRNVESAEFEVYFSAFKVQSTKENWDKLRNSYLQLSKKETIVKIKYLVAKSLYLKNIYLRDN